MLDDAVGEGEMVKERSMELERVIVSYLSSCVTSLVFSSLDWVSE